MSDGDGGFISPISPAPIERISATKRAFDVVVASALLVATAPLMLVLAVVVRVTSRGPVFYRSERHRSTGGTFHAYKFRTMVPETRQVIILNDGPARTELEREFKVKDDPRVTAVGRFLRRSSLDELPQLFNVLKGEMSMVGPRPKLVTEALRYGDHFREIMTVRPGLTGNWQTRGRNDLPFDDRIGLDLEYVRGHNLKWDVKLCLITARQLLSPRRHGAY